jgi:hypothetical protein
LEVRRTGAVLLAGEAVLLLRRGEASLGALAAARERLGSDGVAVVCSLCAGGEPEGLRAALEDASCAALCAEALAQAVESADKSAKLEVLTALRRVLESRAAMRRAAQSGQQRGKRRAVVVEEDEDGEDEKEDCLGLWPGVGEQLARLCAAGSGTRLDVAAASCLLRLAEQSCACRRVAGPAVLVSLARWHEATVGGALAAAGLRSAARVSWAAEAWSELADLATVDSAELERDGRRTARQLTARLDAARSVVGRARALALLCVLLGRMGPRRRRKCVPQGLRSAALERLIDCPDCAVPLLLEATEEPAVRTVVEEQLVETLLFAGVDWTVWPFLGFAPVAVERVARRLGTLEAARACRLTPGMSPGVFLELAESSDEAARELGGDAAVWRAWLQWEAAPWEQRIARL